MSDSKNYFLYKRQYPSIETILTGRKLNLLEFKKNAVFVLDTNSLLVPYNLGRESLNEIKNIYGVLGHERLFVAAHSLREFAKHRSSKISDLFTEVDKALSSMPVIKDLDYPILGDLDAYKRLTEFRKDFSNFIKPYKEILKDLQSSINEWNWFDPVTQLYNEIFVMGNIIDTEADEAKLSSEFDDRMENNIPPGNRDENKNINAIGDFLIWKSILEFGKSKSIDIVLVTNDEKNDWMLKGNKKSISTRFELVDEFCRFTGGMQFTCLNFADFLKINGATADVVNEVATAVEVISTNEFYSNIEYRLTAIKRIIRSFLAEAIEDNITFIKDNSFEPLVKGLLSLFKYDQLDVLRYPKSVLIEVENEINKLLRLNHMINVESTRIRKATYNEHLELRELCKQVMVLIEDLEFMLI